ncbi:MAG TPA: hypothetical protein VF310_02790, partial [Vicinamibacteria bacterium]
MEDQRRLLIAIALSLLVLTAYQMFLAPPPHRPAPSPSPAASASGSPAAAASPSPPAAPASPGAPRAKGSPAPAAAAPTPAPPVADDKERRVEVVGPEIALAFSNRGARLISWTLNTFRDSAGRPEEMVLATAGGVRPLDLETGDRDVDEQLRTALFRASTEHLELRAGAPLKLEFR